LPQGLNPRKFGTAMIGRRKAEKQAARSARLSVALRENLKRRKAQARGRSRTAALASEASAAPNQSEVPDFRRNPGPNSEPHDL